MPSPSTSRCVNGSFAVHDPEGQLVIFVQQRPASSKTVSPRAASHRIIHTGFWVHDRAAEDHFWRDILGFRPYWFGGQHDGEINYVSSQVPDGTDWIEYMLNRGANSQRAFARQHEPLLAWRGPHERCGSGARPQRLQRAGVLARPRWDATARSSSISSTPTLPGSSSWSSSPRGTPAAHRLRASAQEHQGEERENR